MKKYYMHVGVFMALMILLTGFKKNTHQAFLSEKPVNIISDVSLFTELPEIIIPDITVIQGDKGQTPAEVIVCLSQVSSEPVTLEYSTQNGTAIAGVDYVATSGSIRFEPGEIAKWITVPIIGEVAADPDEDSPPQLPTIIRLIIKNVKGGIINKATEIITIIQNILRNPQFNKGPGSAYSVIFEYDGYTTLGPTLADCHIRRNGKVSLWGILEGFENIAADDDVTYTGHLWMEIKMDICSVEHSETTDPPDRYCYMSVAGFGYVDASLKLDSLDGYAYINFDCDTSKFHRNVVGDCFSQLLGERQNVPLNSIASIFNGLKLKILTQRRTLREGGDYYQTDNEGNVISVQVLRKIR